MVENITDIIQRKIWTAEDISKKLDDLIEKSMTISPDERKMLPTTISNWSEDKVKKSIESLERAIVNPLRHKNKEKLKKIGIDVEKIPDEIFDNTELIDDILKYFNEINKIDEIVANILIEAKGIEKWLIESPEIIIQKFQDILDIGPRAKDIANRNIDEQFKRELIIRTLRDTSFIDDAEEVLSNTDYLSSFEILIDYSVKFEELINDLNDLSEKINNLVDDFGLPEKEIKEKVKGKSHKNAQIIIEKMQNEYSREKERLIDEIQMYSSVLRSFGSETLEESELNEKTLPELQELLEEIKKKSLEHLDESGMRIFKFLKGEESFPGDIDLDEVKTSLERLRPIFLKGLKEGS